MKNNSVRWIPAILLLAAAFPAFAQDAAPPPSPAGAAAPATTDLGEIVVQARRRDEKILDVPVAVTVQSGEQLREANAVLFEDVGRAVPNLLMGQSPRSVSALDVTLRGQSSISSAIVYDPAVGIYVDGVYVANGQAAMGTLLDIESVEVVRGVQGTLFGRNNTGGAVLFSSVRPQFGETNALASVALGGSRLVEARGIVNAPVSDSLALRLAFQDNERAGYGSSTGSGQDGFGNRHRYQARGSALWRPGGGFEAYMTLEHMEAHEVGALLHPLHGTAVEQIGMALPLVGLPPAIVPDNPYQTNADQFAHDTTRLDAAQFTLTQRLGAWADAKLILGYRHLHNDTAIDVDAMNLPFANTTLINGSSQKSMEFQLSGIALAKRLDWIAGMYWFRDDGSAGSLLQPPSAQLAILEFQGQGIDFTQLPPQQQALILSPVSEVNAAQNLSDAGFFHGEFHWSDRFSTAAGFRYTSDTRRLAENSFAQTPFGPSCTILDQSTLDPVTGMPLPANGGGPCPPVNLEAMYSYWSWEFSARYRFDERTSVYLRTGRGQRSGGWNAPVSSLQDQPFAPERLTDVELGVKSALMGGAVLLGADVFTGSYDQMQRLLPQLVGTSPTTYVINAGKARVSGFEAEANAWLSRTFSLQAALGVTDARYRQFEYSPGNGQPPVDLAGNRFNMTPRWNASLGALWIARMEAGSLRVHADFAWRDLIELNVINDSNRSPSYGTLNLRSVWQPSASPIEIAAFVTNATGRTGSVAGGSVASQPGNLAAPPAVSWQIPTAPREYGVEFSYHFGH